MKQEEFWENLPFPLDHYCISSKGRMLDCKGGRVFEGRPKGNYLGIELKSRFGVEYWYIHRLVMFAFVGYSSLEVNHKNGFKFDNSLENLEYVTRLNNQRHAINEGLSKNKLSWEKVEEVKSLRENGLTNVEIAKIYGVKPPAIHKICKGITWNINNKEKLCVKEHFEHSDDYIQKYI
jgi:hypothetical protein